MKSHRKNLRFELLQSRLLMAVDTSGGFDASESYTASQISFLASLNTTFPWLGRSSIKVGDHVLSVEEYGVRLLSPSKDGFAESDSFRVNDSNGQASVVSVDNIGNRVLVVTRSVNPLQTNSITTLSLLDVDSNGTFTRVSSVKRKSDFQFVSVVDDLFVVNYLVDDGLSGSTAEANGASNTFVQPSQSPSVTRLFDVIRDNSTRIDVKPTLASNDLLRVFSSGNGRAVVGATVATAGAVSQTNSDILTIDLLDPSNSKTVKLPASLSRLTHVEYDLTGFKFYGPISGTNSSYGVVSSDDPGTVVELLSGDKGRLQIEAESFGNGIFLQRDTGVAVHRTFNSENLRVVTSGENGYSEQILELPGHKVGLRPAFVIDSNTILALRAEVKEILENTNADLMTAKPELKAYLLKRSSNGQFSTVNVSSLGNFDFRSSGRVSTDGVVTLQNPTESKVLRILGENIEIESFDVSTIGSGRISGFEVATLVSGNSETKVLTLNGKSVDVVFQAVGSALDANSDGNIGPLDVLTIVNFINAGRSTNEYVKTLDTNRDGIVSPLDVLRVINEINRSVSGEGEGNAIQAYALNEDLLELSLKRKNSRNG